MGFEPGTSDLLGKIVTERSRVLVPMRAKFFSCLKNCNYFLLCTIKRLRYYSHARIISSLAHWFFWRIHIGYSRSCNTQLLHYTRITVQFCVPKELFFLFCTTTAITATHCAICKGDFRGLRELDLPCKKKHEYIKYKIHYNTAYFDARFMFFQFNFRLAKLMTSETLDSFFSIFFLFFLDFIFWRENSNEALLSMIILCLHISSAQHVLEIERMRLLTDFRPFWEPSKNSWKFELTKVLWLWQKVHLLT